jgi:hypothetical protein
MKEKFRYIGVSLTLERSYMGENLARSINANGGLSLELEKYDDSEVAARVYPKRTNGRARIELNHLLYTARIQS